MSNDLYLIPPEKRISFFTSGTVPDSEQLLESDESPFQRIVVIFAPQSPIRGLGELSVWLLAMLKEYR